MLRTLHHYFTRGEKALWLVSVGLILASFLGFDRSNYLTLAASLIGVTSLIFAAKGNPIGPVLMIVFSLLYGVISYTFAYYGEMITYLGMTMPMSAISLAAWLRHPYQQNRAEVSVNRISRVEIVWLCVLSAVVTFAFYYILAYFHTANLAPSLLSVTTSFAAVYLTWRRSPWYAVAYAANDVVLIVLWTLATMADVSYLSVTVCFVVFLANDLYGFISWREMEKRQRVG